MVNIIFSDKDKNLNVFHVGSMNVIEVFEFMANARTGFNDNGIPLSVRDLYEKEEKNNNSLSFFGLEVDDVMLAELSHNRSHDKLFSKLPMSYEEKHAAILYFYVDDLKNVRLAYPELISVYFTDGINDVSKYYRDRLKDAIEKFYPHQNRYVVYAQKDRILMALYALNMEKKPTKAYVMSEGFREFGIKLEKIKDIIEDYEAIINKDYKDIDIFVEKTAQRYEDLRTTLEKIFGKKGNSSLELEF